MKERPILFSTPMVKAILDGRKTVTRRIINPQPLNNVDWTSWGYTCFTPKNYISGRGWFPSPSEESGKRYGEKFIKIPYGVKGDILWVRETFAIQKYFNGLTEECFPIYKTDYPGPVDWNWKPSIFMPKPACRLKLEIISIRVERLHDITEEDAIREGVQENVCETTTNCVSSLCLNGCSGKGEYYRYPVDFEGEPCYSAGESFESLWTSINGQESWDQNPWVWRIEFSSRIAKQ